jgi:hypothetical protein
MSSGADDGYRIMLISNAVGKVRTRDTFLLLAQVSHNASPRFIYYSPITEPEVLSHAASALETATPSYQKDCASQIASFRVTMDSYM